MKQTLVEQGKTDALLPGFVQVNEISLLRAANVHNLKVELNIESEVMDGNSNGFWFVYAFPGNAIDLADFPASWSNFDDENVSQYQWGSGLWMASNQTPFHLQFMPKTTRNLPKEGRVVLYVKVEGSVPLLGLNRINSSVQFHINP